LTISKRDPRDNSALAATRSEESERAVLKPQKTLELKFQTYQFRGRIGHCPPMAHPDIHVRHAGTRDRKSIADIDPRIAKDLHRREVIDAAIAARQCWVAERSGQAAGYGILSRNFFARDFVELLYVHEGQRRRGVGAAMLTAIEAACLADRLFTSTNESNTPMRALLARSGYAESGRIENLDPGDPEVLFVKFLPRSAAKQQSR
jgi:GNAT superfamily N-acetyltransferase